jgi:shikimate dehydrogenase
MPEHAPENVSDLLEIGLLRFASKPPMNPRRLDFRCYTVPLIEHDYPAKTPAMWNSAYQAFGLEAGNIILTGDPRNAPLIYAALRRDPRYRGGGAGVGFKETAFELVDELDAFATAAGSVNFVSNRAGWLCGHNTDGIGFAAALEDLMRPESIRGKTVLILGAGGTARSVGVALAERGARLSIVNRTARRAEVLAAHINSRFAEHIAAGTGENDIARLAPVSDVIVNVSIKGAAGPLAGYSALGPGSVSASENLSAASAILDCIPQDVVLCDVVIAEGGTPFLREARRRGFTVLDGIGMVVNQAVEAFWILHGVELQSASASKFDVARVMRSAAAAT